jgi:ankyrin repeat protein
MFEQKTMLRHCGLQLRKAIPRFVRFLLENGADVNASDSTSGRKPMHQAAQNGLLETLKVLLEYKADPDVKEADGVTPLWLAAQGGHKDVMKALLNYNANPNTQTIDSGRYPIHQAA